MRQSKQTVWRWVNVLMALTLLQCGGTNGGTKTDGGVVDCR